MGEIVGRGKNPDAFAHVRGEVFEVAVDEPCAGGMCEREKDCVDRGGEQRVRCEVCVGQAGAS